MDYAQVVGVLREWDSSLGELSKKGRIDGHLYSDLLKDYVDRLTPLLPALRVPSRMLTPKWGAGPQEDIVNEDEDEELLSIFIDSFQQNFSELRSLSPAFPESTLSEKDLERARELLKRSLSSARYMDYGQAVNALKEWDEVLVESSTSQPISGRLFSRLLDTYGKRLQHFLPGMRTGRDDSAEEEQEEEDNELLEIFLTSFEQSLSELKALAPPLPDAELSAVDFERAEELLKRSISSAHYMGYDRIVSLLKEWEQSLHPSHRAGATSGEVYSGALEKYGLLLEELLNARKKPIAPSTPSNDGESSAHEDRHFSDMLTDRLDEPLSSPPGSTAEDISRELAAEERLLQELSPDLEQPAKRGERAPVGGKEAGTIVTLRVNVQKVDQLLNQVMELVVRRSEFVDTSASFMTLLRELASLGKLSKEDLRKLRSIGLRLNESTLSLGRVASDMQTSVMRVRMLPISQLFMRFPRVVRDQALKLGKRVELALSGGETEIDKHVLEQMYDPLVQFLRNAIVHGIESPEERKLSGKPELGAIRLSAYQEGDYVVLDIEDDGRGIDTQKLGGILKKRGEMSSEDVDRLPDEELIQAIFLPGISTHGMVDGTAGRGVGLDVVKENVERMNGTIEVQSEPGVGTRFTVRIPLTVAIIRALLVKGANQVFALPLNAISQILRYRQEEVNTIEGFQVIQQRGKTVPLVRLSQLLGVRHQHQENGGRFVVVVATAFREVGLVVEGLRGEREIVIKPIEDELHTFEGFSGATILGDGSISLILDVSGLLRSMKNRLSVPGRSYNPSLH
jgi:two-component system chemotaxis sensor kinase CheA